MPITLTVPEGLLDDQALSVAFSGVTDAVLEVSGLAGNPFMAANMIGTINVLPREHVLAASKPVNAAFIELKLPAVALISLEEKQAFIEKATDAVEKAAAGRIRRNHIWSNIVYAPEGAWGIAGQSYDNAALISSIMGQNGEA